MPRAYVWTRFPDTTEGWHLKIARLLGIPLAPDVNGKLTPVAHGAHVSGSDGTSIWVRTARVYRHMVKDHPTRKGWIPLIVNTIREGIPYQEPPGHPGELHFAAGRTIVTKETGKKKMYFLTTARLDRRHPKRGFQWRSTFDISKQNYKKHAEGSHQKRLPPAPKELVPPAPNPLSIPGNDGRGRPGASTTYSTSARQTSSSLGRLLLVLGGIYLLAHLVNQEALG